MVILIKFQKREITGGIKAWYWNLIVLNRIQINNPPPIEPEVEGVFLKQKKKRYILLEL